MDTRINEYVANKYGLDNLELFKSGQLLINDKKLDKLCNEIRKERGEEGKRIFKIEIKDIPDNEVEDYIKQIKNRLSSTF